jgi:hypothetical protein
MVNPKRIFLCVAVCLCLVYYTHAKVIEPCVTKVARRLERLDLDQAEIPNSCSATAVKINYNHFAGDVCYIALVGMNFGRPTFQSRTEANLLVKQLETKLGRDCVREVFASVLNPKDFLCRNDGFEGWDTLASSCRREFPNGI